MKIRSLVLIIALLIFSGCATQLPPKIEISDSATIGYINLFDDKAKHAHVGTTIFSNFTTLDVSDWNMDLVVEEIVQKNLQGKANYDIKKVVPTNEFKEQRTDLISSGWDTFKVNPKFVPLLNKLKTDQGIDILVVFNPFYSRVEYNVPVSADGYGLYTRCVLKICRAQALNHVTVNIFETNPGALLAWGVATEYEYKVEVSFPDKIKNIETAEIDKAKPYVVQHLIERFKSAISRAGL